MFATHFGEHWTCEPVTDFEPILRDANRRLSAGLRAAGKSVWSADIGDRQPSTAG